MAAIYSGRPESEGEKVESVCNGTRGPGNNLNILQTCYYDAQVLVISPDPLWAVKQVRALCTGPGTFQFSQ